MQESSRQHHTEALQFNDCNTQRQRPYSQCGCFDAIYFRSALAKFWRIVSKDIGQLCACCN